ncbi:MAG: transcription factor FapR [Thermaerobacter sp.]|nr:transcription factor FapR [Bacillota bacterium]
MQTRAEHRRQRQRRLRQVLEENPFLTDEELAARFDVSVQTIRLDRLALGIPELRERTREMAERSYSLVKSIGAREIVGELVDLELGRWGISILETTPDMVFEKTRIVRSHFLFAQADSLALAIIDADVAVTGIVNVKYKRPVTAGERLVARAEVIRVKGDDKFVVQVVTRSGQEQVFRAKFMIFALSGEKDGVVAP